MIQVTQQARWPLAKKTNISLMWLVEELSIDVAMVSVDLVNKDEMGVKRHCNVLVLFHHHWQCTVHCSYSIALAKA